MDDLKKRFREWMLHRDTKIAGRTYTPKTVEKCVTTLNTVLGKFGVNYFTPPKDNTIFSCETLEVFSELERRLRSDSRFDYLDGPGKGQRWIHNGLRLYRDFLYEKEGKGEDERDDFYESIVTGNHRDGKKIAYYTTKYERNKENREAAIRAHGMKCQCCGFDFEKTYGEIGKGFIEVHHVVPLSYLGEAVTINPHTDLVCLCSNCHRMIHRRIDGIITVEELRNMIEKRKE